MKTIVIKNLRKKTKNNNREVRLKIINGFFIVRFITFCLNKLREIINYHQNIISTNDFIKRLNRYNLLHLNHNLRYKIEKKL